MMDEEVRRVSWDARTSHCNALPKLLNSAVAGTMEHMVFLQSLLPSILLAMESELSLIEAGRLAPVRN